MLPLYLDILVKIKIAYLFGKVSVIEKNGIIAIPYKDINTNTKNHYNNLIGKVECNTNTNNNKYMFYYIPLKNIENYELKNIGIEIYPNILVCPFCFGIHLDIEEQYKYYKMMKKKEQVKKDEKNMNINLNTTITDDMYKILKNHFCFELIKKNCEATNAKEPRFPRAPSFTKEKL